MSKPIDQEREAFEKEFKVPNGTHFSDGRYQYADHEIIDCIKHAEQWKGWQARASVQPAGGAVPEAYKCTPKSGGTPFVILRAPDSWELRECDIEVVPVHAGEDETDKSIAADSYWHISEVIGTEAGWSVQEHVEFMRENLQETLAYLKLYPSEQSKEIERRITLCLKGVAPGYTPVLFAAPHPVSGEQPQVLLDDDAFVDEFMTWWEAEGQLVRSGGGDYERAFAFEAWRHLMPKIVELQTLPAAQDVAGLVEALGAARAHIGGQKVKVTPINVNGRSGYRFEDENLSTMRVLDKIDAALAAHRAQQGEQP